MALLCGELMIKLDGNALWGINDKVQRALLCGELMIKFRGHCYVEN